MKPYLRMKKIKGCGKWKEDVHPPKGYINWWENMCNFISRKTFKQELKRDVDKITAQ